MSKAWLKASLALWRRRERARKKLHTRAQADLVKARANGEDAATLARLEQRRNLRSRQLREARARIALREQQLADLAGPRIITARQLGLRFQYLWGAKGGLVRGASHYTADSRAETGDELVAKVRIYHRLHGGGVAYEALFADDGTIVLGNPANRKGAAVAALNTGMWNICHPGTTGHTIAPKALESMRWYLANAHTRKIPKAHRAPRDLRRSGLDWRPHREHPGQSTACPGNMIPQYKELHG